MHIFVTISHSHKKTWLSFAPKRVTKVMFEVNFRFIICYIIFNAIFMSENQAKFFEVFKRLLLDFLI